MVKGARGRKKLSLALLGFRSLLRPPHLFVSSHDSLSSVYSALAVRLFPPLSSGDEEGDLSLCFFVLFSSPGYLYRANTPFLSPYEYRRGVPSPGPLSPFLYSSSRISSLSPPFAISLSSSVGGEGGGEGAFPLAARGNLETGTPLGGVITGLG